MTLKWGQRENDKAATTAPAHWHNWSNVGIGCSPRTTLTCPFVSILRLFSLSPFSLTPFDFHSADLISCVMGAMYDRINLILSLTQLLLPFQPSLIKFVFFSRKLWRQSLPWNYSSYFIASFFLIDSSSLHVRLYCLFIFFFSHIDVNPLLSFFKNKDNWILWYDIYI